MSLAKVHTKPPKYRLVLATIATGIVPQNLSNGNTLGTGVDLNTSTGKCWATLQIQTIAFTRTKRYLRANFTVANAVVSAFSSCTIAEANQ